MLKVGPIQWRVGNLRIKDNDVVRFSPFVVDGLRVVLVANQFRPLGAPVEDYVELAFALIAASGRNVGVSSVVETVLSLVSPEFRGRTR